MNSVIAFENDTEKNAVFKLMQTAQQRITANLHAVFQTIHIPSDNLRQAIEYVCFPTGKAFRPTLIYATAQALQINVESINAAAAAIECIHTYSLVHDDLPAMDNDELRRGRPTCHIAFDEATAVLVGDGLLTLAFEILASPIFNPISPKHRIQQVLSLSQAAGVSGMVAGQVLDILNQRVSDTELDLNALRQIHSFKTGKLIRCCIELCLPLAPDLAKTERIQLQVFADYLGLIFQIKDDLLDVTGSTETLGKTTGSDARSDKMTFPSILGMEACENLLSSLLHEAMACLECLNVLDTGPLRALANFAANRDR
ncbi:MAG: farnesyl diphosphate synthase [Pseudomonadota bacterium]